MIAPDTIACPHCGAQIPLSEALRTHMREDFEQTLHARLTEERAKALAQAKADLAIEYANLTTELTEKATQLEDSRTRELALLKKARTLEDEKAALDLELERRLQAERATIEETVETRLAEQHRLRDMEKDKQLGDLRRQIEELKRKAEQGSQQAQGEAPNSIWRPCSGPPFRKTRSRRFPKGSAAPMSFSG